MLLTRAGFGYGSGVIVDTMVGLEEVMILGKEGRGSGGVRGGQQHRYISALSRDCLCQCREETQHRCWEQLDTDTSFYKLLIFISKSILSRNSDMNEASVKVHMPHYTN